MPDRPFRPCKHSGCTALTRDKSGYCDAHKIASSYSKEYEHHRGSPSKRGYDNTWQRLRVIYLHENPLCEMCLKEGIVMQAEEIHHIVTIRIDGNKRLDESNLMSLCKSHHSQITAKGE